MTGIEDQSFYIADNTYYAFNELLQTAVELGWVGVLLWLFLLSNSPVSSFKKIIWAVPLIAFVTTSLTTSPFREIQHQLLFFTILDIFTDFQSKLKFANAHDILDEISNSKIKAFRASARGVRDINFFLFRLANVYT